MAIVVELPRLSDTMEEGVVAAWKIQVGDTVKRGQVIAEIETDKATMEFESFDPGTVLALVADPGKTLPIGSPIAVLGDPGEDPSSVLGSHGGGSSSSSGSSSAAKASSSETPPSSTDGKSTPESEENANSSNQSATQTVTVSDDERRIPASPVARKLAREGGVDLREVSGSGPNGRVVKADVEAALGGAPAAKGEAAKESVESVSFSPERDELGRPYVKRPSAKVPLTQMRKTIARRMTQSQQEIPHFYLTIDIDMEAAAGFRANYNLAVEGTKVSYNDMLILATAKALREHPRCNASYTAEGIVEHGDIHVGVAVAIDDGLVVPVVRHAEQKTLRAISLEVRDLGKRAKKKTLAPNEMSGGSFTVSNLGMFGIEQFSAVVNPGEGGILAVGAVADTAVVKGGEIVVRKRMKATLSCDHRVIDGAVGAQFLQTLQEYLETPMKLFT